MKTKLVACIVTLALCIGPSSAQQTVLAHRPAASVCGYWVVTRIIPTSNVQASPNKRFLGWNARYLPQKAQFGRRFSVTHPLYREKLWTRAGFSGYARISASELGIREGPILEVDVLDSSGRDVVEAGSMLFVRNEEAVVTIWNGVYYELRRVGRPCRER